jgi:predicted enzyme related to lactoylglutathione lyase
MPPNHLAAQSQITFFYYHDLTGPAHFYETVMGFELVDDQGFARIYRVSDSSFVGLVSGPKGFRQPQAYNAVLLTVLVNDVDGWYAHLKAQGARLLTELLDKPEIGVRCFFLEDPGGYALEIQEFLKPHLREVFHR